VLPPQSQTSPNNTVYDVCVSYGLGAKVAGGLKRVYSFMHETYA